MVWRQENSAWIIAGDHVFSYNVGDRSLWMHDENSIMSDAETIYEVQFRTLSIQNLCLGYGIATYA